MSATTDTAAEVAQAYFDAFSSHDVDAAVALWAPGGREHVRGQVDTTAPDGVRAFVGGVVAAFPDWRFTETELTSDGHRVAVRWRSRGTFAGEPFAGFAPTGAVIELEGVDVLTIVDGRITNNDAFTDSMAFARQIGAMPAAGSKGEARMAGAFNARTRVVKRLSGSAPEQLAEGVWVVRGGTPKTMNVYLVRDGDGVLAFDAGVRTMGPAVAAAAASLGGLTRIVLGHGHLDHRGVASQLGVPVLCHPDARDDAEGEGGERYFDYSKLPIPFRWVLPQILHQGDGGPVAIDDTVREGDEVAGFRVVDLPGHAPGQIGLWREADRVVLSSDCFYTMDPLTGRPGAPRVPHVAFNFDTEGAKAAIRKLAALEPALALPGHRDGLHGDVRAQLEQVAAA